jgi:predicted AlkP superfamily phosphohydrolase/phosphomutase
MVFGLHRNRHLLGIGLDGVPYHMARQMMDAGLMPNLRALAEEGTFKEIKSVYPPVSSVAWAAFQTGRNPAEFGVFGFVELRPNFDIYIPNHGDLKCRTIWKQLDTAGRKYVSLGIPMTYPAPHVNGLIVSGFLAPDLNERAVSRPEMLEKLRGTGYEIDVNPAVAAESVELFKQDLVRVSQARQRTALALLEEDDEWDFFFVHVIDTDRLNHFMWRCQHEAEGQDRDFFYDFYRDVDGFVGRLREAAGDECGLMICSDHGFCELKWEFQLNRWLKEQGYLNYEDAPEKAYKAVRPGSRAVSLVPGRIYLLREGVWQGGAVSESQCEPLRQELMAKLRLVRHPDSGELVCNKVMAREEVYRGRFIDAAPDIIIDPCDGYDLQAKMGTGRVFEKGLRSGMHTYDGAMMLVNERMAALAAAEDIAELGRLTAKYLT